MGQSGLGLPMPFYQALAQYSIKNFLGKWKSTKTLHKNRRLLSDKITKITLFGNVKQKADGHKINPAAF